MSKPIVLLVDDEPGLLKLFSALLGRLACQVYTADGGAAALDILDQMTPNLLILDLAMPEVSGYQVLRYVRGLTRLDRMRVMILTARPSMVPEVEELGIDCWVSKPIMPQDFLEIVSHELDSLY